MDEGRKGREGNLFDDMYEKLRRPANRPVSPVIPHTPKAERDKKQEERLRKYREKRMIPDNPGEIGSQDINLEAFARDSKASDEETEKEEEIRRMARELRNTKKLIATSIGYTLSS